MCLLFGRGLFRNLRWRRRETMEKRGEALRANPFDVRAHGGGFEAPHANAVHGVLVSARIGGTYTKERECRAAISLLAMLSVCCYVTSAPAPSSPCRGAWAPAPAARAAAAAKHRRGWAGGVIRGENSATQPNSPLSFFGVQRAGTGWVQGGYRVGTGWVQGGYIFSWPNFVKFRRNAAKISSQSMQIGWKMVK